MCIPGKSEDDRNAEKKSAGAMSSSSGAASFQPCSPKYAIKVTVTTRAGEIPLPGLVVKVDGSIMGTTNDEGKAGPGVLRDKPTVELEVIYHNSREKLKKEVFSLTLAGVSAPGQAATPGMGRNFISKVRDVLGAGGPALAGDKDFTDEYSMGSQVVWEPHPDGKDKIIHITVRMATISLLVAYLNQNASNETIQTGSNTTHTFSGWQVCMPTSTTMLLSYWGSRLDGDTVSRNSLMQYLWNESPAPTVDYPSPWQRWGELHSGVSELLSVDISSSGLKSRKEIPGVSTPADHVGNHPDHQTPPSAFADEIAKRIAKGEPMAISTDATDGHIMLIRGAVVTNQNNAMWLILNDPYGNLSGEKSIYGKLRIAQPVGLLGTNIADDMNSSDDVVAVQAALQELGKYKGEINGRCEGDNADDPTVKAIKAIQGTKGDGQISPGGGTEKIINAKLNAMHSSKYSNKEEEINTASGEGSDRGRHVYYNNETEGKFGHLHLRAKDRFLIITRSPEFTKDEVRQRLVPGNGE